MRIAEYIWLDGNSPAQLRSKTKVLPDDCDVSDLPIWGFDGSSTKQAAGGASDCVLRPVMVTGDPIRGGENMLVFCEVLNVDMTPHTSNTRRTCENAQVTHGEQEPWARIHLDTRFTTTGFPRQRISRATRTILL